MASADSHVISPKDLLTLRYYYYVRKWGKDVVFLIYKCTFIHRNPLTIRQLLENSGVTFGRRGLFNATEVDLISTKPPEDLDITALNKICQALWEKRVNYLSDTLCNLIRQIKNERNEACHGEGDISESELDNKLQTFGKLLEDTLVEAKKFHPHHVTEFDELNCKIIETIPKIKEKIRERYDPRNPEDLKKFKAEIEEFGDLLSDFILERSGKELKMHYEVLCRILPFDWVTQYGVVSPCEFMVSLRMGSEKEFQSRSDDKPIIIDYSEILVRRDFDDYDPSVVIVSGDAGSGKTTMLCSIVEKWNAKADSIANITSFQMLLYMQFRMHKYNNFDSYLQDTLQHAVLTFGFKYVKSSVLNSKCLFLCDGFDEFNANSIDLFKEILEVTSKNTKMKIVVTTRPGKTNELTSHVTKSKHCRINFTVLGLRKDDMESHTTTLVNYLVRDETRRDEMVREIAKFLVTLDFSLKQILRNPLWLNLFILLYIECPNLRDKIGNPTMLYLQVKKYCKIRLAEKLGVGKEVIDKFDEEYKRMSLYYYEQRKFEISAEDTSTLERTCTDLGLDFDQVMSSYFNVKHTKRDLEILNVFCYRHKSEQEFNAAFGICDEIKKCHEKEPDQFNIMKNAKENRIRKFLSNINDTEDQEELLIYITGILYNTDVDLLHLLIDDIIDLHQQCTNGEEKESLLIFLFETRNDEYVLQAVSNLYCGETWEELMVHNSMTLPCLPYLLPKIKLKEIAFDLDNLPQDLCLLRALEIASQNNVEIILINTEFLNRGSGNSDELIAAAKTCTDFRGRLTNSGINKLPSTLEFLWIRMEFHLFPELLNRLQDLKHLNLLSK